MHEDFLVRNGLPPNTQSASEELILGGSKLRSYFNRFGPKFTELSERVDKLPLRWFAVSFLPRNASAERGDATVSRLSVCPSVCL